MIIYNINHSMRKNFVEELRWRGMLAQMMPGTKEPPVTRALLTGPACYLHFLPYTSRTSYT
jgi:hypothetical protein